MTSSPALHELARYLCSRSGSSSVIVVTNRAAEVGKLYPADYPLYLISLEGTANSHTSIPIDKLDAAFLADKILVCDFNGVGYSHLKTLIRAFRLQRLAVFSLLAYKQSYFWRICLQKLYRLQRIAFWGENENELLAVGGKAAAVHTHSYPLLRCLAVIPQFNEIDIIEPVIKHLLSQGVDVHVIDNWSDDGSFEKVTALAKQQPDRISIERFPDKANNKYECCLLYTSSNEWLLLLDVNDMSRQSIIEQLHNSLDSLRRSSQQQAVISAAPEINANNALAVACSRSLIVKRPHFIDAGGLLKTLSLSDALRGLLCYSALAKSIITISTLATDYTQLPEYSGKELSKSDLYIRLQLSFQSAQNSNQVHGRFDALTARFYRLAQLNFILKWLVSSRIAFRLKLARIKNLLVAAAHANKQALAVELKHIRNELIKTQGPVVDMAARKKTEQSQLAVSYTHLVGVPDRQIW